jgi:hypothetical protein
LRSSVYLPGRLAMGIVNVYVSAASLNLSRVDRSLIIFNKSETDWLTDKKM